MQQKNTKPVKGFTLIELLIVIAIIAILAAVAFVALDPLTRFQKARDSARWTDIGGIIDAIKLYQVDNNGNFPDYDADEDTTYGISMDDVSDNGGAGWVDVWYMIGTGATTSETGCATSAFACDDVEDDGVLTADTQCINLNDLVESGYLGSIPTAPTSPSQTWTNTIFKGYALRIASSGTVSVQACDSEDSTASFDGNISISR